MENFKQFENVSKLKIVPLDESQFDHCIDNVHFNSVGANCEFTLDPLLTKKLRELICEEIKDERLEVMKRVRVESDFTFSAKNDDVKFMMLDFGIVRDKLNDFYLNALTKILKEVFGTNDVSLKTDEKWVIAYWLIDDKKQMLWLIDKLNELDINTESTFKVVSV
jgi:hypothetical protein